MEVLSLGEKIKKLRKDKNLTLKELAGDRITAAQISHIERDKSHTSYEVLEYLSERLDVSVEYLLENKEIQSKKIVENLIVESEILVKTNKFEKAEMKLNKAIDICEEFELDDIGKCYFLIADIRKREHNLDDAIEKIQKALYFFIKNEDKTNIFLSYIKIGEVYIDREIHIVAIDYLKLAQQMLGSIKDENSITKEEFSDSVKRLYNNFVTCYSRDNNPENALIYIQKLEEIDQIKPKQLNELLIEAESLFKVGNYDSSKEVYEEALKIVNEDESKDIMADIYFNMADVYTKSGDVENALVYSNKAFEINKNSQDDKLIKSLFRVTDAYINKKDYDLAIKYCKIALATALRNRDKKTEFEALKKYSHIMLKKGDINAALENLVKSAEIAENLQDKKELYDLYVELGMMYENISDEKQFYYYKKAINIVK
ncbi:MAG: tetratricopeptide repeat protein [Clostridioides sp.]|nr:tetratricopeptide repeat protein [Clostridioides sp.]